MPRLGKSKRFATRRSSSIGPRSPNQVDLQPPWPLQAFWPLQLFLPSTLQPAWPLQEFWPLQACLAAAGAAAPIMGAALDAAAGAPGALLEDGLLAGGVLPQPPVTPSTIPDTAAAMRLSVILMVFVPFV